MDRRCGGTMPAVGARLDNQSISIIFCLDFCLACRWIDNGVCNIFRKEMRKERNENYRNLSGFC